MYKDLIQLMKEMRDQDHTKSTKMIFLGRLRAALIDRGITVETAETLCAMMKLNISEGSLTDDQITECVEIFSDIVAKMKDAFAAQGFIDVERALVNAAGDLSFSI